MRKIIMCKTHLSIIIVCLTVACFLNFIDYPAIVTDYNNIDTVILMSENKNQTLTFEHVIEFKHIQPNMPEDMYGDMHFKFKYNDKYVTVQSGLANYEIEDNTFYIIWHDEFYEGGMFDYGGW